MARTIFEQSMFESSYSTLICECILQQKKISNEAWQKLVAKNLRQMVACGDPESIRYVQDNGGDYMLAASKIISSAPKEMTV